MGFSGGLGKPANATDESTPNFRVERWGASAPIQIVKQVNSWNEGTCCPCPCPSPSTMHAHITPGAVQTLDRDTSSLLTFLPTNTTFGLGPSSWTFELFVSAGVPASHDNHDYHVHTCLATIGVHVRSRHASSRPDAISIVRAAGQRFPILVLPTTTAEDVAAAASATDQSLRVDIMDGKIHRLTVVYDASLARQEQRLRLEVDNIVVSNGNNNIIGGYFLDIYPSIQIGTTGWSSLTPRRLSTTTVPSESIINIVDSSGYVYHAIGLSRFAKKEPQLLDPGTYPSTDSAPSIYAYHPLPVKHMDFDGKGLAYASTKMIPRISKLKAGFTVALRLKYAGTQADIRSVFGWGTRTGGGAYICGRYFDVRNARLGLTTTSNTGTTHATFPSSSTNLLDGLVHEIFIVVDHNGSTRFYSDGVCDTTFNPEESGLDLDQTSSSSVESEDESDPESESILYIGRHIGGGATEGERRGFVGEIHAAAVWRYPLSTEEVLTVSTTNPHGAGAGAFVDLLSSRGSDLVGWWIFDGDSDDRSLHSSHITMNHERYTDTI